MVEFERRPSNGYIFQTSQFRVSYHAPLLSHLPSVTQQENFCLEWLNLADVRSRRCARITHAPRRSTTSFARLAVNSTSTGRMPVRKPHHLFGRQGSEGQATRATSQDSPTLATALTSGSRQQSANSTLTQALRISESKSLSPSSLKSSLSDSEPVSFAPVMAATPAGYS